jgi:hypothetical protein
MPLTRPTPPPEVTAAFTDRLYLFLSGPTPGRDGKLDAEGYVGKPPSIPSFGDISSSPGTASIHDPQHIYVLDFRNGYFAPPVDSGWRLFAGLQQFLCVMGRVAKRHDASAWKLTGAFYGDPVANRDRVWDVLQASGALDGLPEIQTATYELRVLAVPRLNLETFWLVNQTAGGSDLVVPFPAAPEQPIAALNTAAAYPMDDFLSRIDPLLKRVASAHPSAGS